MEKTKKITVTSTWLAKHDFEVPADANTRDVGELAKLMHLISLDPDGGGDISPEIAELVDWQVHD
jgi:hypothetical protein